MLPAAGTMPPSAKKQKVKEYFPDQKKIAYKGPDSLDPLAFKYYNAEEVVMGKKMKDWLRFAVCYWHTWKGNGADIFGLSGSYERPWNTEDTIEGAHRRRRHRQRRPRPCGGCALRCRRAGAGGRAL
jgi:hypothetical protein